MSTQKYINFNLPEFAFLDGNSQDGDSLADRTVIQHVRSYTIVDVISLDEIGTYSFGETKTHKFEFVNFAGVIEKYMLVLHFTLADESQLTEIFEKIANWYWDYLTWEDKNKIIIL